MTPDTTALRKSVPVHSSMLRDALQCSPDCVKLVNELGVVEFFNDNGLCLMEIKDPSIVVGVQWALLWPEQERSKLNSAFERAKATGNSGFQGFCPTAAGTPKWWDVVISALPTEPNGLKRFVVTSRDRTETVELERSRQQLSNRLNEIFRAGADVLWDIDLINDQVWWGEGMQSMFGYGPEQVGTSTQWCHEHMHPDDRERVVKSMSDAIINGDIRWESQFRYRKADGSYLDVLDRGSIIRDGQGKAIRFVGIMQDHTSHKQSEEHERALSREMAHRMNNMVAVITGLFNMTIRKSANLEEFATSFGNRLIALSNAHSVLVRNTQDGADLEELIKTQLAPFLGSDRISIRGPKISLSLQVAQGVALAVNELATNAIKHGALSSESGRVHLTWERSPSEVGGLTISWMESGGKPVTHPTRKGMGTKLIDHGIPGAQVKREFRPSGMECTIALREDNVLSAFTD